MFVSQHELNIFSSLVDDGVGRDPYLPAAADHPLRAVSAEAARHDFCRHRRDHNGRGQDGRLDAEHGRAEDGGRRRDVPQEALRGPRHYQTSVPGTDSLLNSILYGSLNNEC